MIPLAEINIKELTKEVYELIAISSIELGYKTDGKTMAVLAKTFSEDLKTENRFKRLYFSDVKAAFKNGVRLDVPQQYLSIPTFFKWLRTQKTLIDADIYKVRTLNQPKETAPLYRDLPKLLTNKINKNG